MTNLVTDSEQLQAMYEAHTPSIDEVILRALTLFRLGAGSTRFIREGGTPAADITFDLTDPPRRLPESWTEEEQRTAAATVTLRLLGVSDLHSEGRLSVDATMQATLVGLNLNTAHHLEGLRATYGKQQLAGLSEVDLHQISLTPDGSTISLTFDLPYFPERPPRKWTNQGLDTVTVGLDLLGVESFSLRGWPAEDSMVDIDLTAGAERLTVHLSNRAMSGTVHASLLSVRGFSAYRKNRRADR